MAKNKIEISLEVKSPLDAALWKQAIESIARHFTPAELGKVARKLEDPAIRSQIKRLI